jgi:hypothetical protein
MVNSAEKQKASRETIGLLGILAGEVAIALGLILWFIVYPDGTFDLGRPYYVLYLIAFIGGPIAIIVSIILLYTKGPKYVPAHLLPKKEPEIDAVARKYPRMYIDIEQIEGIGPVRAKALRNVGIKYTDDLEDSNVKMLASKTGLSETRLIEWKAIAEIMHLDQVERQFSEVLVRSGIMSIEDLAASDPGKLTLKINKEIDSIDDRMVQVPVNESRVASWIEDAKNLLKKAAAK